MAVVIRLQGLPVVAGSANIRHFFSGLHIPDGGVHIVGGELGEAFVIFATDEDARRAMVRSGGLIKKSRIELYLSSKAEMQNTVEINRRNERLSTHRGTGAVGNHSNLVTDKKGMNSSGYSSRLEMRENTNGTRRVASSKAHYGSDSVEIKPMLSGNLQYLNLAGMSFNITEEEIRDFFKGLRVDEVILLRHPDGRKKGKAMVKFASNKDAIKGLKLHKEYIGSRFVFITESTEDKWVKIGGSLPDRQRLSRIRSRERSPPREHYSKHRTDSLSPPRKRRVRSRSPPNHEFYVHMKNLPVAVEKRDIRQFFGELDLTNTQIKIISTKHNTMDAFVLFPNDVDYKKALGFHKELFRDQRVYIYAISRKSMLEVIESYEAYQRKKSGTEEQKDEHLTDQQLEALSDGRTCIYIRNFPFDVSKVEVQKFFVGFHVHEDDIYLLTDEKGVGLGEALVKFSSEDQAKNAECLDGRRFLGTEVLLRRIAEKQLEEFGLKSYSRLPKSKDLSPPPLPPLPALPPLPPLPPLQLPPSYGAKDYLHPFDFRSGSDELRISADHFRRPPPHVDFGNADTFGKARMERFHEGMLTDKGIDNFSTGLTKIKLTNLPFTATVNEILDFLYGYRVIPESVTILYTKQGMPTGIAIVSMPSYEEAIAAVRELNERPVGPRKVSLSLFTDMELMQPL